ncbi:hypothetical protein CBM2631_A90304 [Cupriavidus taiwanensis]|nr:hypothetical protein CBM2631_A90304 [Cupriavidus taiwanensis]
MAKFFKDAFWGEASLDFECDACQNEKERPNPPYRSFRTPLQSTRRCRGVFLAYGRLMSVGSSDV